MQRVKIFINTVACRFSAYVYLLIAFACVLCIAAHLLVACVFEPTNTYSHVWNMHVNILKDCRATDVWWAKRNVQSLLDNRSARFRSFGIGQISRSCNFFIFRRRKSSYLTFKLISSKLNCCEFFLLIHFFENRQVKQVYLLLPQKVQLTHIYSVLSSIHIAHK